MQPERVQPDVCAVKMRECLEEGLRRERNTVPMIPTYLRADGAIRPGFSAAVIDAGGTNFRCGLVTFTEDGYEVSGLRKALMPGIDRSISWEEFISYVADAVAPLLPETDCIGFCFSYAAVIQPDIDGRVIRVDKEVVITGCEGKLVGASLKAELARRGITGKSVVIVNDTAAVLLGISATLDHSLYSGFIGQVSGTGTNTCCILPENRIEKLGSQREDGVIVNLESGLYDGLPLGDFDRQVDEESTNPGFKYLEKMTAGVYLGELARLMVLSAAEEGCVSPACGEAVRALGRFDASVVDGWACGEVPDGLSPADKSFVQELALSIFDRSARCMCTNLLAIVLLTGEGREKPVCVCAEGSLVQKSRVYRPLLEGYLAQYAPGRRIVMTVGNDVTLPGSAAAALLNR